MPMSPRLGLAGLLSSLLIGCVPLPVQVAGPVEDLALDPTGRRGAFSVRTRDRIDVWVSDSRAALEAQPERLQI